MQSFKQMPVNNNKQLAFEIAYIKFIEGININLITLEMTPILNKCLFVLWKCAAIKSNLLK